MLDFCSGLAFPLTAAMVAASLVFIVKRYWANRIEIPELFLCIVFGIVLYVGIIYLFDRIFNLKIRSAIKESLASIWGT